MSINASLSLFLDEYPKHIDKPFRNSDLAKFIRDDIPEQIQDIMNLDDRYEIKGSAGQGNWARVPWLCILDKRITDTPQDGYYIVYLPCEDFSGVYLSLNQGVTTIRETYKSDAMHALQARANNFAAQLGKIKDDIKLGPIDLKRTKTGGLAPFYEKGSVCSKFYPVDKLPDDFILQNDLQYFIDLYLSLSSIEIRIAHHDLDIDELELENEDLTQLKEHKRYERNLKLVEKVKKIHGYKCAACGFCFSNVYGTIGNMFIEAHHLIPLSNLKGLKVTLDPKNDFAVLCSNCHRMIHRSNYISDIEGFKKNHLKLT